MTIIIMINTYKDHVKNYFEPPGMCAGLESMATSRIVLAMLKKNQIACDSMMRFLVMIILNLIS